MAIREIEGLSLLGTCTLQDLANARLNAFAVLLLIESYRQLVEDGWKPGEINFAFAGVHVCIKPFEPKPEGAQCAPAAAEKTPELKLNLKVKNEPPPPPQAA